MSSQGAVSFVRRSDSDDSDRTAPHRTHPFGPIDVVSEGEEGVGADGHGLQGADPALLLSR